MMKERSQHVERTVQLTNRDLNELVMRNCFLRESQRLSSLSILETFPWIDAFSIQEKVQSVEMQQQDLYRKFQNKNERTNFRSFGHAHCIERGTASCFVGVFLLTNVFCSRIAFLYVVILLIST